MPEYTHTPAELTRLADALGIGRESYPELYAPEYLSSFAAQRGEPSGFRINLPSPLSDSPRAVLWEPFLMRALGWPSVRADINRGFVVRKEWFQQYREETSAAALFRAYEAQNPAWRGEG